jgi:hypothetical protein
MRSVKQLKGNKPAGALGITKICHLLYLFAKIVTLNQVFTYNDFTYSIGKCEITIPFFIYCYK